MELINEFINEDIVYNESNLKNSHQLKLFAIKSSSNCSLLDVARQTLKETQDDIYEYFDSCFGN